MNKIIYTCITGDYDTLLEPKWKGDWQFICYTTNKNLRSTTWEIRYIEPQEDLRKQSRLIKIKPPFEYDICLWIDGNIQIISNIDEFIKPFIHYDFALMHHPHRSNIIQEGFAIVKYEKDSIKTIERQIFDYIKDEYHCNELCATGIMFRRSGDAINKFCDIWSYEVKTHSSRDQMSIGYSLWKSNLQFYKFGYIPQETFLYHTHAPFKQNNFRVTPQRGKPGHTVAGRKIRRR